MNQHYEKYKHYIIYTITNNINGKIYIGKHKCNELDDSYFGSGKRLWLAINKYGIENFTFHMEIDLHNQQEMDLLEELVVNKDFLQRTDVYNISKGGKNPCMYGSNNPFYGKSHSEETKLKISNTHKGKHLTEEQKKKISTGLKKLYFEHPEVCLKLATTKNKKLCTNVLTNERKYFNVDNIPDGFEIHIKDRSYIPVSDEKKKENQRLHSERNKKSKWYNNGICEKFCLPDQVPEGFVLGRLPTINVGRKYSDETISKMSKCKIGNIPGNKGKVFITNGIENKYISKNDPLPEGWRYGLSRKCKQ